MRTLIMMRTYMIPIGIGWWLIIDEGSFQKFLYCIFLFVLRILPFFIIIVYFWFFRFSRCY
uniref:Putative ovule protein n=1 Tax=Solanum chacoense TaxID=4108 RepID=A0A0V0IN79_SOLCH